MRRRLSFTALVLLLLAAPAAHAERRPAPPAAAQAPAPSPAAAPPAAPAPPAAAQAPAPPAAAQAPAPPAAAQAPAPPAAAGLDLAPPPGPDTAPPAAPAARLDLIPVPGAPPVGAPAAGAARDAEAPSLARAAAVSYLVGAGTALLTVPSMMVLGADLGGRSSDLTAAAVPSLLLMAIIPPLAVTTSEWLVMRKMAPGARFHPAIWAATGINLLAVVVGAVAGVWARDPGSLAAFTVVDALLMPAGTTLVLTYARRTPRRAAPLLPPAAPATLPPVAPAAAAPQTFVPSVSFSF